NLNCGQRSALQERRAADPACAVLHPAACRRLLAEGCLTGPLFSQILARIESLMEQSIPTTAAAATDWLSISPSEAGFTSDLEALLDKAITEKRVWNLHGLVIVRKRRLGLERYFDGDDNARGRPLGKVAFKADTLHDLRSVSKSIVGLLYGIALADGKVPPPEAP